MSARGALAYLKSQGYRDTQPRRMVLAALQKSRRPLSPVAIRHWITARGWTINTVTVYRILDLLRSLELVHHSTKDDAFSLCPTPGKSGHHLSLRCTNCGTSQEFHTPGLCTPALSLIRKSGFTPLQHLCELLGRCSACSR